MDILSQLEFVAPLPPLFSDVRLFEYFGESMENAACTPKVVVVSQSLPGYFGESIPKAQKRRVLERSLLRKNFSVASTARATSVGLRSFFLPH